MKIVVGLLLDKLITKKDDIENAINDIGTYIYQVDKLIVFNISGKNQDLFYRALKQYNHTYSQISYVDCEDLGQVYNYQLVLNQVITEKADYGIILEQDVFFEKESFKEMKNIIINEKLAASIITPMPLYTCLEHKQTQVLYRKIKGSRLVGAFINMKNYQSSTGFVEEYYQTTFDYDYCLSERLKGNDVILICNAILRDRKYRVIERRVLFFKKTSFDRDLYDIYYETRNRLYLWKKYKDIDNEYIKLDQKLFRKEKRELRLIDRNYHDKRIVIHQAERDFQKGLMGKKRQL